MPSCTRIDPDHQGQFLICSDCGRTDELADGGISDLLQRRAEALGFVLSHQTIELRGRCAECRRSAAA
jgi:Fur family zinc uptake transcriptional regulator